MTALPAHTRDTFRRVGASAPVEGHGDDSGHARPERDTGATPPLPDSPIARRLAELGAALHKAGQIAESLSRDVEICLAGSRGQSVMDDVVEATRSTGAEPKSSIEDHLFTVGDLARLLRLDERTVRRHRKQGLLPPAIDLGGVLRWRRGAIERWLDEHQESWA